MVRSGDTAVMTLSHNNDPFLTSHHHHAQPQNFSRPHHHSVSSVGSGNSGPAVNGVSGSAHGGINGASVPSKGPDGNTNGLPNGRPSTQSTTTSSRMSSFGGNASNGGLDRDAREMSRKQAGGGGGAGGVGGGVPLPSTATPTSLESSYFPPYSNGSAMHSTSTSISGAPNGDQPTASSSLPSPPPNGSNHTPTNSITPKSLELQPGHYTTQPSSSRFSPTSIPSASSSSALGASSSQQLAPGPPTLRQRHTLHVPDPRTGRTTTTTPASGTEVVASGRFSPTAAAPRRASISLGRRGTRSLHSEMHIDEIPQDEDAAKWTEAIKAKRASKRRKQEEADEDKVVVGTKVDQNHVNWIMAYNMLTGIRFVVSRVNAKMERPLTDVDFDAKHKFSFDITGNELTPSAKYDFKFKDYSPWVFRHLREKFGLDPADYLMSLTSKYILSELGSPGKSGSFFYFSRDYKYIIKTIHHGEHLFLRRILRDYYKHVEDNPNTLISQFYGLHRVKTPFGRKIHFVVMNNLFPPHRDIHQTFDLKGSTIGRDFKEEDLAENPRATLKDLNWLRRDMHLEFGSQKKALFIEQVQRDVELLKKLEIMDYSLLIGIHDLTRGNRDDIRNSALKVFQPGGAENEDLHGHMLQRTPSKMEKARQANQLRKIINSEIPVTLDSSANRLPEEFLEQKNTVFYGDDGGFRATHENDDPGEVIYYLGIIDCLTHYGFVKRMEHFWRGLSNPKDQVSAIPPSGYGDRFFKFITGLVKSPEEAARDKENQENAVTAEGVAPPQQSENDVLDRAHMQAESSRGGANEGERHARSMGTIRSPSAERTGGVSGTVLPIVEEAGEGSSTGARSQSRTGSTRSGHTEEERHSMGYSRPRTPPRTTAEALPSPQPLNRLPASPSPSTTIYNLGKSQIMQKHDRDDLDIRVARVSS